MNTLIQYNWIIICVAVVSLTFNIIIRRMNKPPEDGVHAQFVATTTGCVGCLVVGSLVFGIIASLVSIFTGIYKIFH